MSDTQQGPDWWMASDGKWYPPQQAQQPAQPVGPPMGQPMYGAAPIQTNNSNATVALVLGIVGMVFCGLFTGIPAIIVGSKARKEIRESGGTQGGDGLALGGVILGWVSTVLSVVGVVLWIVLVAAVGTSVNTIDGGINSDPANGVCDYDRFVQDPDC